MEISTNPEKSAPRPGWIWAERALLLAGILCLGIVAWSWLDARIFEMRENAKLEAALAAAPPHP